MLQCSLPVELLVVSNLQLRDKFYGGSDRPVDHFSPERRAPEMCNAEERSIRI